MKNIFIALLLATTILFSLPASVRASYSGRANTAALLGAAYMYANYQATGNVGLPYMVYPFARYGYGGSNYYQPTQTICTCTNYPVYSTYANYGGYGNYAGYGAYGYGSPYMSYPYSSMNYSAYNHPIYSGSYGYPTSALNNNFLLSTLYYYSQNRTSNLVTNPVQPAPVRSVESQYDYNGTPSYGSGFDYNGTPDTSSWDYSGQTH